MQNTHNKLIDQQPTKNTCMSKKYHLYGLGAALVDTEIEVDDNFLAQANIEKGVMTLVDEARQHQLLEHLKDHLVGSKRASGGSAANSIIAASHFGASAFYSCKVADDDNGHFYLSDLAQAGVHSNPHGGSVDDSAPGITGKCLVMITPDAERTMNTFLGISETLGTPELNTAALLDSEYLYIEGYLVTSDTGREAAIQARQLAEANGVKTAISLSDPGMVQFFTEGLRAMIGDQVDILFCNEHEALSWTAADSIAEAARLLTQDARCFAITLGADGALVYDGKNFIDIPPHPVEAIDSNGAGDMFAGAFLYAISHGHDHASAGKLACRSAAELVCHYGPRLPAANHQQLLNEVLAPV
jgi:sugar/nucleoside kinase (ribokinase family)